MGEPASLPLDAFKLRDLLTLCAPDRIRESLARLNQAVLSPFFLTEKTNPSPHLRVVSGEWEVRRPEKKRIFVAEKSNPSPWAFNPSRPFSVKG